MKPKITVFLCLNLITWPRIPKIGIQDAFINCYVKSKLQLSRFYRLLDISKSILICQNSRTKPMVLRARVEWKLMIFKFKKWSWYMAPNHITCWIQYFPRWRSWPNFVWSLSLPLLTISFDHMHPLSPVHFSSSHSLPAFSMFVLVFLFLYYHSLQISKPSL